MLWIGTWYHGLRRFDRNTQTFKSFRYAANDPRSLSHNHVFSIFEDHAGALWIGTENGLNQFDRTTATFTRHQHDLDDPQSLSDNAVRAIYEDRSHTLWIGTERGGLNKRSRSGEAFRNHRHEPNNPRSLSDNEVLSIHQDRDGVLWIGTFAGGLNRFDPAKREFEVYRHEPNNRYGVSHDRVMSIFEDRKGTLWVGTQGGLSRLNREDRKQVEFKNHQHDPGNSLSVSNSRILSIYEDRAGVLWIGTWGDGLNRFDRKAETFKNYQHDPNNDQSLRNNDIQAIYEDPDEAGKALWLGTFAGLERFDRETETFQYYQLDKDVRQRRRYYDIKAIHKDRAGNLWVASFGGGLYRLLATASPADAEFRRYREQDGLPNDFVTGILEDDRGALWISTRNGLAKFDPKTGTWKKYEATDGLPGNVFNASACYRNAGGEMFFGGLNGVVAFHPDSVANNTLVPPVVISRFSRYNAGDPEGNAIVEKGISDRLHLELSYQDKILIFEFAALNYNNSAKNQYAYKLEGFNKNWILLGHKREATFTNLSPGEYTLLVKGANNDGVWNEDGATLKITIAPPWWKTWWAYALYAVLFIGLLHALRRYELNRQQYKHRLELEKVEAEKLKDLDQMKSRFFANISHEFRTPLTLILGQIDSALPAVAERKTKRKLLVAYRNARQLLRLIRQLLDLSKLEAGSMALKAERGNLVGFLKNLVFSFEALAERKRIDLRFHSDREKIELLYDAEKLEMVFYNLLSNAFKFTPEGGRVIVECGLGIADPSIPDFGMRRADSEKASAPQAGSSTIRNPQSAITVVKDTGIGIPAASLPHIFDRFYQVDSSHTRAHEGTGIGLALAKELVELHHGDISVTSKEGVGTAFVIKLPLEPVISDQFSVISDQLPVISEQYQKIEHHEAMMEDATIQNSNTPPIQKSIDPAIQPSNQELVLLVEDNADIRAYMREHLEDHYQIIEAANGEEGLGRAQEAIPDLIITDVMMPKLDGYQMSCLLKQDERTSHIPIIMLTAKASLDSKIAGLETGVDDYLIKPFSTKELLVRVRNLIALRRQLRARFSTATLIKPSEIAATSVDQAFLQRALACVEARLEDEQFGVDQLAEAVHMSVSQINRKLKALIDQPAGQLIRSMRLQRAADLLKQNAGTVAEIAYRLGFGSQAHFTTMFLKQFGCTPSEYKKRQ
jgi:signal transduction histidine kinase/DNA-binding response OmpR family regulator